MYKKNERDKKFMTILFDKIYDLSSQVSGAVLEVDKLNQSIGCESNLPNIAIELNNKIVFLQQEFERNGISMFSEENELEGYIGSSFVGNAIIEDLLGRVSKGMNDLSEYNYELLKATEQRQGRIESLKKTVPRTKTFAIIKNLIDPPRLNDMQYTQEELDAISSKINNYKESTEGVDSYNIEDDIVSSIIKKIIGDDISENNISYLVNNRIIPVIKQLGHEEKIEELKQKIIEQYKGGPSDYIKSNDEPKAASKNEADGLVI